MRCKTTSIFTRWNLYTSQKCTTHLLFAAEAAGFGDRFDAMVRFLKPAPRSVDTNGLYCFGRRPPAFRYIRSCEVPGAHVDPFCQSLDLEIARQMLGNPLIEFAERF